MRRGGGWKISKCTGLALALAALPAAAAAQGAQPRPAPKTTAECMSQWRSVMADPRPDNKGNGLPPDEMCLNSRRLPADEGRCRKIYEEVLKAYSEAERSVKNLCALVPKAYAARCDGQGSCQAGTAEFRQQYATVLETHNQNVRQLVARMEEMAQLGMNTSEQFANDLKELKNAADPRLNTETARRHGGATVTDALRNHSGQDAETVLRILQRARETSTISQREIETQIRSPYIFESLQASAVALDQKRDLENYASGLGRESRAAALAAKTGTERNTSMSSLNGSLNGLNLPAGLPAVPLAAPAATGGGGDISVPTGSQYPVAGVTPDGIAQNPAAGTGLRTRTALGGNVLGEGLGATASPVAAPAVAANGGLVAVASSQGADSTAASSPLPQTMKQGGGSLRELLRARMARRGAAGDDLDATGTGSGGRRANYALGPDGKPLIGGAELDTRDPNAGRMPPMMMQNSETEDAVKAMVTDFEHTLSPGGRSLASEFDGGNEILSSDTPSLFLRLREVHVRCIKRGCVTQVHGKGKI